MRSSAPRARLGWQERVVLLLGLLGVAWIWLPGLPTWGEAFLGIDYVDALGTQWFYWFVDHELSAGRPLGHTDLFFYPWGKDIFAHTGTNVLDAVLAMPVRRLLGPVLGYNLFVIAGLAASAWAFYALLGDHVRDPFARRAAFLAFVLCPYPLFEVMQGRPTQAILLFPILFLRHALRTGWRRGPIDPIIAGLALAVSGYQYWYYAFFGGLVCLGYGLVVAFTERSGGPVRTLSRFALVAAVALLVVSPVGVPLALQASESEVPGLLNMHLWTLHSNPPTTVEGMTVGLFLWQPLRHFAGYFVVAPDGTERFLVQTVLITPPLVAAGVLGALLAPARRRLGLVVALLITAGVGCGPFLLLGQTALPNLLYMVMIDALGALQRLWWPARMVAFTVMLAPLGLGLLLSALRRRSRAAPTVLCLAIGAPWAIDLADNHLAPMPTWSAAIPAGYRCLAEGPPGPLIDLPFDWTQAHLYYQSAHGRPILGGMLEDNPVFTPVELTDLRARNPFLERLLTLGQTRTKEQRERSALRSRGLSTGEEGAETGAKAETADSSADSSTDIGTTAGATAGPIMGDPIDPKGDLVAMGYRYVIWQIDSVTPAATTKSLADNALRTRARRMTRELGELLGEPVYEDARTAIFSLDGGPRPCATEGWVPDAEAIGYRMNPAADIRQVPTAKTEIFRLGEGLVDTRGMWADESIRVLPHVPTPRTWKGGDWPTTERQKAAEAEANKQRNQESRP